ncbi:MAG: hypothetical protein ABGZ17_15050 [Planctomycetaceae bacterium]
MQYLYLARTQVTDEGLEFFEGLTNPKVVWLKETAVTYAGAMVLKEVFPQCRIPFTGRQRDAQVGTRSWMDLSCTTTTNHPSL